MKKLFAVTALGVLTLLGQGLVMPSYGAEEPSLPVSGCILFGKDASAKRVEIVLVGKNGFLMKKMGVVYPDSKCGKTFRESTKDFFGDVSVWLKKSNKNTYKVFMQVSLADERFLVKHPIKVKTLSDIRKRFLTVYGDTLVKENETETFHIIPKGTLMFPDGVDGYIAVLSDNAKVSSLQWDPEKKSFYFLEKK